MLCRQFLNLLGKEICPVRDRVVVEHARKPRSVENGRNVRFHLPPIPLVHIRRKHHQAVTAEF